MKAFLTVLLVLIAVMLLYKYHHDQVETASLEAAARARSAALASIPKATPTPEPPPPPPPIHAVMVSRGLESLYQQVFADLNREHPVDLVPPLQMTREHILDAKVRADAPMQPVYDLGEKVAAAMVDVAEERTKALQALLESAARPQAALDGKNPTVTTNSFFLQTAAKRWDGERRRRKPSVDALMTSLRTAERNWNGGLPTDAPVDTYAAPDYQQLLITVEPVTRANPLERQAYDQKRAIYPWRRYYYDQYGYRYYYR